MSQLKVSVNDITCERTTREWSHDEIFALLSTVAFRTDGTKIMPQGEQPTAMLLSRIEERVSKGYRWSPFDQGIALEYDEAPAYVVVQLALFEKDRGDVYQSLGGIVNDQELQESALNQVIAEIESRVPDVFFNLGASAYADLAILWGKSLVKGMMRDDELGRRILTRKPGDDATSLLEFTGHRGKYVASVSAELLGN